VVEDLVGVFCGSHKFDPWTNCCSFLCHLGGKRLPVCVIMHRDARSSRVPLDAFLAPPEEIKCIYYDLSGGKVYELEGAIFPRLAILYSTLQHPKPNVMCVQYCTQSAVISSNHNHIN